MHFQTKKIGIVVENKSAQELQFFLEQCQYALDNDIHLFLFAENPMLPGFKVPFPSMDMKEAWEFDGTLIMTNPAIAEKASRFASPEHKIWLIGNPFWLFNPVPAQALYNLINEYEDGLLFANADTRTIVNKNFKIDGPVIQGNVFKFIDEKFPNTNEPCRLL